MSEEFAFVHEIGKREGHVYELYHENSKLNLFSRSRPMTAEQIYITTRSVRRSPGGISVQVPQTNDRTAFDEILGNRRSTTKSGEPVDFLQLSCLIRASAGITGFLQEGDGPPFALRAAPSGGALYPIDLFIVALSCEGLARGVYYFHPFLEELQLLANADPNRIAHEGFFSQDFASEAAVIVLMVASFKRTSCKYGERGYRLCLLDAGHMAENIVLKATEMGCLNAPVAGFFDDLIASELQLDGVTEAVVHSVVVGGRDHDKIRNPR